MSKKKTIKQSIDPDELFQGWWTKTGSKKTQEMEKAYLKENPDYDPEDDDMTDSGCVHRMMHEGEAWNMTYDESETAFLQGYNNQKKDTGLLYCELDSIVDEAYEAGKKFRRNN